VDPLLWKQISELFAAARLLDGERRIAFLKEKCGQDDDLFRQVKSLLDIDGQPGPLDSKSTLSMLQLPQIVANRFRIIRYIAEGGMGTVYEAEDLRLNDRVALKTIRSDIARDPNAVERFKREILLGKKVTHPNVCRVHDLGVDRLENGAEILFLTMQFLSGETLSSRIKRGPITKAEALPLIEDMVDALSAAHQVEVIHRDFKSGNVMLVPGAQRTCSVVTDFGLARGIRDGSSITQGAIVGTVEYMAPEQIRGEELTPATDIYALGVVMYEMATGQRPFTGESKLTIAFKHLNHEPQPPGDLAPQLDRNWEETILDCLRKSPGDRFQSAAEVKEALVQNGAKPRSHITGSRLKQATPVKLIALSVAFTLALLILSAIPSFRFKVEEWLHVGSVPHAGQLAVLPLVLPTDDAQSAALEYGLADTLATRLTKLTGNRPLQIVPASEIRAKGITTLEQARQEFGVNFGLELSLHRSGELVRVNYGLVDAKTHRQLRGDTITAPMSDGFAIEDRVADSVVKALELDLQPQEKQLLAEHGTHEPVAYDYYLEGRGYLQEYQKPENVESAITVFHHALEKDPKYALAFSGLGQAYWRKYEMTKESRWAEQAGSACESSLSLDDKQADGHSCLGLVYNGTGKYDEAAHQYQLALDLEPTNDDAIRGLGSAYVNLGRLSEAEQTYRRAIAVRPNYWREYNALGALYMNEGRYSQAAEMFSRVIDLAPDSFRGYSNLGGAYVYLGRYSDAIKTFKQSLSIRPTSDAYSNLATTYFRLREFEDAAHNYSQALAFNDQNYVLWGNLGDALYYSGKRRSESVSAFERAISLARASLEVNPRDADVTGDLATYYSMVGNRGQALAYLQTALNLSGAKDAGILFQAALVHNQFGETDEALKWLARAVAGGYSLATISDAPALDNLHSNPKFRALLTSGGSEEK
jgi:serine/threonine protein kinase/tetratricopeptide (TPR) repeat protein